MYPPRWVLHEWSVHTVDLGVESAGVAEVVPRGVPAPQRGLHGPAVDALATLAHELVAGVACKGAKE